MIQFKQLTIENFLSIAEGKLSLTERGLLLISGENQDDPSASSNGAGKSSVVDAICWCLFGETARGVTGDSVVNRAAGKGTRVEVQLTEGASLYTVARHRKHKTGKNRLTLVCDGKDLTEGTDKQTQALIERVLGCSYTVFRAAVYAGQESMPNLPGMTDKELKQVVEEAAGIELLERAHEIARRRQTESQRAYDVVAGKVSLLEANLERAKAQRKQLEADSADWTLNHAARVKADLDAVQMLVTEFKQVRANVQAVDRAALEAAVEEAQQALNDFNRSVPAAPVMARTEPSPPAPALTPLPGASAEVAEAQATVYALGKKEAGLKAELLGHKRQYEQHQRELADIDSRVGTPCGECGKEYCTADLDAARASLNLKINAVWDKLVAGKKALGELVASIGDSERALREAEADHEAQTALVKSANDKLTAEHAALVASVNARNAELRKQYEDALRAHQAALAARDDSQLVAALRDAQGAIHELDRSVARMNALESQIRDRSEAHKRLKAEPNPVQAQITRADAEIERALSERDDSGQALIEVEGVIGDAKALVEMYGPKGIRGEILDTVTPFLNARTAEYLNHLSDGNIVATWDTIGETGKGEMREKFHINVQHSTGSEGFEGLSGGEKRKVRLATAMALQDLVASRASKPIRLFIADEVDDALDVSGLERLLVILEEKARAVGTVLIISHNDIAPWVRSNVTVTKNGGVSTLREAEH